MAAHPPVRRGARRVAATLVATAIGAGCVAACGSSQTASIAGASAKGVPDVTYDGPEAGLATSYAVARPARSFTIGWEVINPNATTAAQLAAAQAETRRLGGKLVSLNDEGEPSTQVQNCKILVSENVNAIVLYPFEPEALQPCFDAAAAKGIQIIAQQDPASASPGALPAHLKTDVLQAWDYSAYLKAKAAAEAAPGSSFAYLGLAIPIAAFAYEQQRLIYWGERFGLKYAGAVNEQGEDAGDADAAMTAILAKYPTVRTVFTVDDPTALPAAHVAEASGRSDLNVIGDDGQADALTAIKQHQLFGTVVVNAPAEARNLVDAAVDQIAGRAVPEFSTTPVTMVTAANVGSATGQS
jgi:ribose transport system substrate-binding protein